MGFHHQFYRGPGCWVYATGFWMHMLHVVCTTYILRNVRRAGGVIFRVFVAGPC